MFFSTLLVCFVFSPVPLPVPHEAAPKEVPVQREKIQTTDRIAAVSLLNTAGAMPDETLLNMVNQNPMLLKAVPEIAVEMEIMDPREVRYFFQNTEEFPTEMRCLSSRFHEFKDAPKLWEVNQLPLRESLHHLINFNRAYGKHLEEYVIWNQDRADIVCLVQKENQCLYRLYDAVRDARCDFYYVTVRRAALLKVKRLLEEDQFLKAMCPEVSYYPLVLPPYVPVWRFNTRN